MENKEIDRESHQIWEKLGDWWDAHVEEGDEFHRAFIFPHIGKLLELRGEEAILDAGCGNGSLTRLMAKKGAEVLGIDFSSSLLQQARARSQAFTSIQYEEMSLTDRERLQELAKRKQFDRIVCSMVLHDISTVVPFFESLRLLLKPNGSFIFSIPHPCFNSPSVLFEPAGCLTVSSYRKQTISKLRSKPGQPIEQIVFHRPIRDYFNLLFENGWLMNGFEEPCTDPKLLSEGSLWSQRPDIPPAMLSRWIMKEHL